MRYFIAALILLISTPSYGKELPTFQTQVAEPQSQDCTDKRNKGCIAVIARLEPLKLERVIDGDTFVASGRKIRIWGINAPEKGKPYYDVATMFLKAVLKDGTLECKFLYRDRYKREVMHCWIDKADIGSMVVEAGLAIDYEKYSGGFYYYQERLARMKNRGMWKNVPYEVGK